MTDDAKILQTPMYVFGAILMVNGFGFMVVPGLTWELSGDPTVGTPGLYRWSGAWLLALGFGCINAGDNPDAQRSFLSILAMGTILASASLAYNIFTGEFRGDVWFLAVPLFFSMMFAPLFLWARYKAD